MPNFPAIYAILEAASRRINMERRAIPLSRRPGDIAILVFFLINILFITYIVDVEQLIIPNPSNFTYPLWPPPAAVDLIHWWGRTFDPVLLARPAWWKVTIWIDSLFFGPFYIDTYVTGKDWIRIPSIIYGSTLITNVLIILGEEIYGIHATPRLPVVILANLPWLLFPIFIIYRMWWYPNPFTELVLPEQASVAEDRAEHAPVPAAE
jgi:EXPERA (EXPanded EBP superfamily)